MYYGLLAPEDKQQALYQGLMGLGSGLLQGSAPSSTPKGMLGGIGQGLQGFQQGMQGYAGAMQQNKMAQVQMADLEAKRKRQADIDANRAKLMMMDPTKLSDPSSLPVIMGASDDPVAAYTSFQKASQPTGPQSSLAKLEADYKAGLISEPVYKAGLAKATTIPGQEAGTYETVQSPFGLGGVGQINRKTGEIRNYQEPRDTSIDHNKLYAPDGTLTVKGMYDRIEPDIKKLTASRAYAGEVRAAVNLAIEKGNPQAALAAMIRFQKALDDGAVVRENDIALSRSAASVSQQISALIENAKTGNPIGQDMLYQMVDTMDAFVNESAMSIRQDVDDYLTEADRLKYNRSSIIQQGKYDRIFTPIESLPRKTQNPPPVSVVPTPEGQAEAGVDYSTMSTDELTKIDTSKLKAEQRKALIDEINKRLTTPPKPLRPLPKRGG